MSERAGALRGHRVVGPTLLADYGGPVLAVTFVGPGTARIRLAPTGTFAPHRSWSRIRPYEDAEAPPVSVWEDAGGVEISSGLLTMRADPDGARVTVTDRRSGDVLLSDGPDGGPEWFGASGGSWTRRMPGGRSNGIIGCASTSSRCSTGWRP